jgi:hypothetical protein
MEFGDGAGVGTDGLCSAIDGGDLSEVRLLCCCWESSGCLSK